MSKRIGVFAGTFDPVHIGHLAFAQAALDAGLEKVWFLVEPRPRRKQGVHALEHRQAMVDLAIADNPRFGSIIIDQPRFTAHQTLPLLEARFKGFRIVLLFGNDVVGHMAGWPHITDLMQSVDLLVAAREADESKIVNNMKYLEKARGLHINYQVIHTDAFAVSSSKLRNLLKQGEQVPDVPQSVQEYITENGLYSSISASS